MSHDKIIRSPNPDKQIPDCDLWTFIRSRLSRDPNHLVLIDHDTKERLTNQELISTVECVAAHLQERGIGPGTFVCYQAKNSNNSLIVMLAGMAAGAVPVPIPLTYSGSSENLIRIFKLTTASYMITSAAFLEHAKELKRFYGNDVKETFITDKSDNSECTSIDVLRKTTPKIPFQKPDLDPKTSHVLVILTSGSTNLPKPALHTHYSLFFQIYIGSESEDKLFDPNDIVLLWGSFMHISGLYLGLVGLALGVTSVVTNPNFNEFIDIVQTYKITTILILPAAFIHLVRIIDDQKGSRMDSLSIKKLFTGGGITGPTFAKRVNDVLPGLKEIRNFYGLTELAGIATWSKRNNKDLKSAGIPINNSLLKIVDPETQEILGRNESGLIYVKSPSIMKCYMNMPEETKEVITEDGWYCTGDVGYVAENSNLYIQDRLKAMIKCLDCQVSPSELEDILQRHPDVLHAAVFGVKMEKYGEAPTAAIILKDPSKAAKELPEALEKMISETCPPNKHLYGGVHIVDSFPKTATDKVDKKKLREMFDSVVKARCS